MSSRGEMPNMHGDHEFSFTPNFVVWPRTACDSLHVVSVRISPPSSPFRSSPSCSRRFGVSQDETSCESTPASCPPHPLAANSFGQHELAIARIARFPSAATSMRHDSAINHLLHRDCPTFCDAALVSFTWPLPNCRSAYGEPNSSAHPAFPLDYLPRTRTRLWLSSLSSALCATRTASRR